MSILFLKWPKQVSKILNYDNLCWIRQISKAIKNEPAVQIHKVTNHATMLW